MLAAAMALDLEAACRAVLSGLGQALILGSILAVLTWTLLRVLRKRVWPALEMALWCVVLLRFVVPGGPSWTGSLATLCAPVVSAPLGAVPEMETPPAVPLPDDPAAEKETARRAAGVTAFRAGWATMIVAAYAGVLLGLATLRGASYRRFRAAHLALPEADARTLRLVRSVCDRVGRRRMPLVRISDDGRAPFVMGVLHPLLVLARHQLARRDELETVVVHEVTHLRRGDTLVRCLQCAAGLLFFFWPVVAWVNRRIDRAREYACDEWALLRGRLTPGQYARCLFEAARWRRSSRWGYAPACMAGHPSTIERRIDLILTLPNRAPRRTLSRRVAMVLLVGWCGFSLTGAAELPSAAKMTYEPTEAGMRQHAQVLFARVKELPGGDVNGDGEVTKEECWAFVTAVVLSQPAETLKAYPWADRNHDGQLEFEEAFCFARGDYDMQDLYKKFEQDFKKTEGGRDEEKKVQLTAKLATAEYATWHLILDRRTRLVAEAKTLPTPEAVRKLFNNEMQSWIADSEYSQIVQRVKEVAKLKEEAKALRTQADSAGAADKPALEEKAAQLEGKAATITGKLQAEINARLEALDARGSTDEAARYRKVLEKLESL
jgi:beta-lactamase regulating signal transducer with metallopeptidase domain